MMSKTKKGNIKYQGISIYTDFLNYSKIYSNLFDYVCLYVSWLIGFILVVLDIAIDIVIAWVRYDDKQN